MHSEIKETIYIALSAIVLSIVLTFMSFTARVRDDIAETRNNEVYGTTNMKRYKEFSKYDKKELCGEEVIECIRMYYDSGISIYVASKDITNITNDYLYNIEEYLKPTSREDFSVTRLMGWFSNDNSYKAYLVYNSENPKEKYTNMIEKYKLTPESITGTKEEKYKILDGLDGYPLQNSDVTSIIIVDYNKL